LVAEELLAREGSVVGGARGRHGGGGGAPRSRQAGLRRRCDFFLFGI
jgi:hypothetical protein